MLGSPLGRKPFSLQAAIGACDAHSQKSMTAHSFIPKIGKPDMEFCARGIITGVAPILISLLLAPAATAQDPKPAIPSGVGTAARPA